VLRVGLPNDSTNLHTMIGVIANPTEQAAVCEFFELFKTPWEFYRSGRQYEVLLCAGDGKGDEHSAKLVLIYAGRKLPWDAEDEVDAVCGRTDTRALSYQGTGIPLYGDSVTFRGKKSVLLVDTELQQPSAYLEQSGERMLARIGYDLFREIGALLTAGQPASNANIPALDLHIALLRDLIVASGARLVEIPPVPQGHQFIACLTHDLDHASIRRHKFDHTMFGFLYRAVFGSLGNLFQGRISVRNLLTNWAAVLKLPFVYMGFAKDFWSGFDDCYLELEKGICSTFFVIPFKDCPGKKSQGLAPKFRAARYGARDIADTIGKIGAAGCEVGLHGIDAWLDSSRGHEELEEIRRLTGVSEIGVRMHWLYYDQQSPATLEQAEAAYDSTIGYNETVGYRAGTTQVYKPFQATRLLELPLHVMDTALFYPSHLGLSPRQATTLLGRLADNAVQFGGCLTINWHDRSLAPERIWDACYRDLVQDLKNRGAWFATGGQAINWFRKRRSAVFETDCAEPDAVRARVSAAKGDNLPGLRLRIHTARESCGASVQGSEGYVDIAFDECVDTRVPCGVGR
jgi:hypothetical protein